MTDSTTSDNHAPNPTKDNDQTKYSLRELVGHLVVEIGLQLFVPLLFTTVLGVMIWAGAWFLVLLLPMMVVCYHHFFKTKK